jgi:hypothetical protein
LCEWGDFIEDARGKQLLTPEHLQRYLRQSTVEGFKFVHRPQVVQGSKITMRVESPRCRTGRVLGENMFMLVWHMESFTLGEKETASRWSAVPSRMASYTPWPMRGSGPQIVANAALGMHPLKVRFRVGLLETNDPNGHQRMLMSRPVGWPKGTLIEWEEELANTIEILPPDARLIEVVNDPAMAEELRNGVDRERAYVRLRSFNGQSQTYGHVMLPPPPMDVAWKGWIEIGEKRWQVLSRRLPRGSRGWHCTCSRSMACRLRISQPRQRPAD